MPSHTDHAQLRLPLLEAIIPGWCDRCQQTYLAIPGVTGCPWHEPKRWGADIRDHRHTPPRQPGAKWGSFCVCGGRKAGGAAMCRECRYPAVVAS